MAALISLKPVKEIKESLFYGPWGVIHQNKLSLNLFITLNFVYSTFNTNLPFYDQFITITHVATLQVIFIYNFLFINTHL